MSQNKKVETEVGRGTAGWGQKILRIELEAGGQAAKAGVLCPLPWPASSWEKLRNTLST